MRNYGRSAAWAEISKPFKYVARRDAKTPSQSPPVSCGICPIRHFTNYKHIFDQRPFAVESLRHARVRFKKGSIVRTEAATTRSLFTLYSGWAARFRLAQDGRRQIVSFHIPGDLIRIETGGVENGSIRALTDIWACEFSAPAMLSLLTETQESALNLLLESTKQNIRSDLALFALGRCTAIERVARLIVDLRQRLNARGFETGHRMVLPLSREDFADALGLTPVHISRIFSTFRDEGIFDFRRGLLKILNERRLLEIAIVE